MAKKINAKDSFKKETMEIITNLLVEKGFKVESGDDYGFSTGTIVIKGEKFDLQIKPISPKVGAERYELAE